MVWYTCNTTAFEDDVFVDKLDAEIGDCQSYVICRTFIDECFEAGESP
jgi:hypothetical protein